MNNNNNSYPDQGTNAVLDLMWQAARSLNFNQDRAQAREPADHHNIDWQKATSSIGMPGGMTKTPDHFTTGWDAVNFVTILPLIADVDPVDTEPYHALG